MGKETAQAVPSKLNLCRQMQSGSHFYRFLATSHYAPAERGNSVLIAAPYEIFGSGSAFLCASRYTQLFPAETANATPLPSREQVAE